MPMQTMIVGRTENRNVVLDKQKIRLRSLLINRGDVIETKWRLIVPRTTSTGQSQNCRSSALLEANRCDRCGAITNIINVLLTLIRFAMKCGTSSW